MTAAIETFGPIIWRVADASGDNVIAFQVSGDEFPLDHGITGAQMIDARTMVAGETFDAYINAAGGATGDYEYNIGRDPIVRSGDWASSGCSRLRARPSLRPQVQQRSSGFS